MARPGQGNQGSTRRGPRISVFRIWREALPARQQRLIDQEISVQHKPDLGIMEPGAGSFKLRRVPDVVLIAEREQWADGGLC